MSRVPCPYNIQDVSGNAEGGVSVEIRDRVTGALATLYSSEAGTGVLGNPLSTDSLGMIPVWVDAGKYNIVVHGSPDYTKAWEAADVAGGVGIVESDVQTGDYTFRLADVGKVVESLASTTVMYTIPADADVEWPDGAVVEVCQIGTGVVTIVAAGGVGLRTPSGSALMAGQYATIGLRRRGPNDWVGSGDFQ